MNGIRSSFSGSATKPARVEMARDHDLAPDRVVGLHVELAAVRDRRKLGGDPVDGHRLATILLEGHHRVLGDQVGQGRAVVLRAARLILRARIDKRDLRQRLPLGVEPEGDLGMVDLQLRGHRLAANQSSERDADLDLPSVMGLDLAPDDGRNHPGADDERRRDPDRQERPEPFPLPGGETHRKLLGWGHRDPDDPTGCILRSLHSVPKKRNQSPP
jgi:hypothetical protein